MKQRFLVWLVTVALSAGHSGSDPARASENDPQEAPRHPDWLYAGDIVTLFSGNTITSLNEGGSYRWWGLYLPEGVIAWVNDQGRNGFGLWYTAQDKLCEVWKPGQEKCWGIRFAGTVVRFDDQFTGQPHTAAVLQRGDTKNLRAEVTPEVQEALRELRESQSEVVAAAGRTDAVGLVATEDAADIEVEAAPKPIKMRIIHPDAQAADQLIDSLSGVQLAAANEHAELVWDVVRGEIVRDNQIIAYSRTKEPSEVQLVIDALHLIDDMEELGAERADGLSLQLAPQRDSYRAGETLTVTLVNQNGRHALLFNVGPYGEIDVIYPVETDFAGDGDVWPGITSTRPLSLTAVAGPPFGANLLVGLVSSSEPRVLLKTLQSGGGPAGISAFLKALRETEGQIAVTNFTIHR